MSSHRRCASRISLVCPTAFFPDQVLAAFVRCFASLLYSYRRALTPAPAGSKKGGLLYKFNPEAFLKNAPSDQIEFLTMLIDTQGTQELPTV